MTDADAVFSTKSREYSAMVFDMARNAVARLRRVFGIEDNEVFRVEVECRYNIYTTEKQYNNVLSKLSKNIRTPLIATSTDDINYTVDVSNLRVTVRKQIDRNFPDQKQSWMIKHTVFPDREVRSRYFDLLNYFQQRGFKFSVSIEFEKPAKFSPPAGTPEFKRSKNRVTFIEGKGKTQVQWDLTKVREQGSDVVKYEIELEKNVPFTEFSETVVNSHLMGCQMKGISYVYSSPILPVPYMKRSGTYSNNVSEAIKDIIESLSGKEPREDDRVIPSIPGSMVPQVVNFQVQNLLEERYQDYCITPKADGYRYFMVVQQDHIVLIQPPNTFKVFARGSQSPFPPGYIFDGELVFKENMIKDPENGPPLKELVATIDYVYYIFDVVKYPDGREINTLMERYLTVERDLFPSGEPIKNGRMLISRKPYLSASNCSWDAVTQYFDEIEKTLHYKTDGLIFTPNQSTYRGLIENKSLKWKPVDMLTMDLRYRGEDGQLFMYNIDLDRESIFAGSKQHPIREKYTMTKPQNIELVDNMIYEFLYIQKTNEMRVTRERSDKAAPNNSKVVVDVWNDIHNPVSSEVLRGESPRGLRECMREALWSWLQNICRGGAVVLDLSNIIPSIDLPVRFLDTEFQKMMLGCTFITDPNAKIDNIDVLIIDGLMFDFLEGNMDDTIPVQDPNLFSLAHSLVKKSKKIFVRGLPSHESDIIAESLSLGPQGEIKIWRKDDKTVHIDSINLEIFRNFNMNTYEVARVSSRIRSFPEGSIVVPAGNRVGTNFINMGPEKILSGKLCGIWDYVVNALLPSESLRDNTTRIKIGEESRLDEIVPISEPMVEAEELTSEMEKIKIVPEEVLKTDQVEDLPPITLESKSKGDVFRCLAYAFFEMSRDIRKDMPEENIDGHARELRLLYGTLTGTELTNAIHDTFGLGIVWVYMLEGDILGTVFPPMSNGKPPKNGYVMIALSLMSVKELSDDMTLITIGERNDPVTLPSSPIIANLMRRNTHAHFMTRTSKELTKILTSQKIINTDRLSSCGLDIVYETLPFRTRLTKLNKTEYTEEDILNVVESSDMSKLRKTGNEILYDVTTTNTKNNILGYTLMKIRSGKLTKQK